MPITINKEENNDLIQSKLDNLNKIIREKEKKKKRKILLETEGSVAFDKEKTALEIQQEMRNEWK